MKKLIMSLAAIVAFATAGAAQDGTVFRTIPMDEALKTATAEGKYVFVDCYTSWCGPCRNMTENIFPLKRVGEYFNPQFVSVKFDIEKEADGQRLAKEYGITSIPTFLVFKPDGTLLHKIVGGSIDAEVFIKKVDESFDDEKAYGALKRIYEAGRRDKEFLMPLIGKFNSVGDDSVQDVVAQLLEQSSFKEKTGPDYWFIFSTPRLSPKGSDNERFLFDNYDAFRKTIGREEVDKRLEPRYREVLKDVVEGKNKMEPADLARIRKQVARAGLDDSYGLSAYSAMADAHVNGDMDRRIKVAGEVAHRMGMWTYMIMYDNASIAGLTPEQRAAWVKAGAGLKETLKGSDHDNFDTMLEAIADRAAKREQEQKQ